MSSLTLVIDLEATCSDGGQISAEQMETIEIGACWVAENGDIIDQFQSFVQPIENPTLTAFCTQLTGINQQNVNSAPLFPDAAASLFQFVERYRTSSSTWMSWGAYDNKQIIRDCSRHVCSNPLSLPHYNAKRMFAKAQKIGKEVGMAKACDLTGLGIEGTHHRALDDARNVGRLLPWVLGKRSLKLV